MTPLTGWLAGRFGIKCVFLISVVGFTLASVLCGLRDEPAQIVIYRMLQGICGAALVPLSQSVLLSDQSARTARPAMAIWGMGVMLGPDHRPGARRLADRQLQLALGVLHQRAGRGARRARHPDVYPRNRHGRRERFDFFGFATLSLAIGAVQMMLDRGELKDWFGSTEIWIEATVAGARPSICSSCIPRPRPTARSSTATC